MKKKPNGFVSVLLALCLLLAPMTVFAESNAQLNYVTDDAGILTDSQWEIWSSVHSRSPKNISAASI